MYVRRCWPSLALIGLCLTVSGRSLAQNLAVKVTIDWSQIVKTSKTTPTLQVVVNPPLRRGTAVHDPVFRALRELQADYVRYVPWLPYPKLGVAELDPPNDSKTSWDFSLIDPITVDFLEATKGHSVVLNFSTIPQWMFKTAKPVSYPSDANEVVWNYEQGQELWDASLETVADYYACLLAWYTQGGFTDELGKRHESGHHYSIPYWEVLNEPDLEHHMSPELYTRVYDAMVSAMRRLQPETKFVGASLAYPSGNPRFFEYFLDHKNHKPGIPLDFISYHFYAVPALEETPEVQQYTFFAQADGFLNIVRYIEAIRQRLSPETGTMINEIGAISADDRAQSRPGHVTKPIPLSYWNLAAAMYAYIFAELSRMGIDVAGESQLVGYPTQYPSVSMVDWETGKPNPRYWVLKLLRDSFHPGDKLVKTQSPTPNVFAWGVISADGKRHVLLINKRDRQVEMTIPGAANGDMQYVDVTTGFRPPAWIQLNSDQVTLNNFAVVVVTLR